MRIKNIMIKPYLITRGLKPANKETPIHFLDQWITPSEYFFIRNHFRYPKITRKAFVLPIEGEVIESDIISYNELVNMPSKTLVFPIECSGNKRAYFDPKVYIFSQLQV